jgi:hypothetical protein
MRQRAVRHDRLHQQQTPVSNTNTEISFNVVVPVGDEKQPADFEAESRPSTPFVSRGRVPVQ